MRELIGKVATSDPGVIKSVYRSEFIRYSECQRTAPFGIKVITARKDGESQKVLEHRYYCRTHGLDFETRTQSQSLHRETKSKPDNDAYLRSYLKRC